MKFNLNEQQLKDCVGGKEFTVVLPKKEGDFADLIIDQDFGELPIETICGIENNKVLFCRVNQVVSALSKGKKIWWCPKCKSLFGSIRGFPNSRNTNGVYYECCLSGREPLCWKILKIEEKKYLECTRKEWSKAGNPSIEPFVKNPKAWVLTARREE